MHVFVSARHANAGVNAMERKKQTPETGYELCDPKLPVIHGRSVGNLVEQQRCGAPLPQDLNAVLQHSEGGSLH